eukprot:845337-Rhodomonas_salina.1
MQRLFLKLISVHVHTEPGACTSRSRSEHFVLWFPADFLHVGANLGIRAWKAARFPFSRRDQDGVVSRSCVLRKNLRDTMLGTGGCVGVSVRVDKGCQYRHSLDC